MKGEPDLDPAEFQNQTRRGAEHYFISRYNKARKSWRWVRSRADERDKAPARRGHPGPNRWVLEGERLLVTDPSFKSPKKTSHEEMGTRFVVVDKARKGKWIAKVQKGQDGLVESLLTWHSESDPDAAHVDYERIGQALSHSSMVGVYDMGKYPSKDGNPIEADDVSTFYGRQSYMSLNVPYWGTVDEGVVSNMMGTGRYSVYRAMHAGRVIAVQVCRGDHMFDFSIE